MNDGKNVDGWGLRSARWDPLWIFLLCALCFGWALGSAPLAGTEGFRALTATQMLESGDWLLPRLYGQLYLRKPPMQYWILAGAEMVAGRANEWVWRLPSALGAAFLAAFLCRTAKAWWGRAAGLTTGVGFLSLGALWSQFRSADIDALNTVFAFFAVIALFELFRESSRRKWAWMIFGGLAFGATLLLKGPAALPLILGAFFAPPLLNSRPRRLLSGHRCGLVVVGLAVFGLYLLAVLHAVDALGNPAAASGLREAGERMTISSWSEFGKAILLPLELFLFAVPSSLAAVFMLRRSVLGSIDRDADMMLRSLVGTFVIAAAIGVVTGMGNPRYGYILLPIFALTAGLLAGQMAAGKLTDRDHRIVNIGLLVAGVLLGIAAMTLSVVLVQWQGGLAYMVSGTIGLVAAVGAIFAWRSVSRPLLHASLVLAIVAVALGFDHIKNAERSERSGRRAGIALAEHVGDDMDVVAGLMIWTHPEIFHYAGVAVDARSRWRFAEPFDLGRSGWVLFHPREWQRWSEVWPERLSRAVELPTHVDGAVLAWYSSFD